MNETFFALAIAFTFLWNAAISTKGSVNSSVHTLVAGEQKMKTCLWLTLLSLAVVTYGATVTPQATAQRPAISQEEEKEVLEETGKSLVALGQLLQGKDVIATKEGQQQLLDVLKALITAEGGVNEEAAEYFLPIIIRGVAQGAIAHVVHKKLNKRG